MMYVLLFLFCVGFLELFMLLGLRKEAGGGYCTGIVHALKTMLRPMANVRISRQA